MITTTSKSCWPGIDRDFYALLRQCGSTDKGVALQEELGKKFVYGEKKPFLYGPPLSIAREYGQQLVSFVRAYHRAIETIIRVSYNNPEVQRVLRPPLELEADLRADVNPKNGKVHLCRLDLFLQEDGNFQVLETNANCPGGLIFAGYAARKWRSYLQTCGIDMPALLDYEDEFWMAKWFLEVAEYETGLRPSFVPILRPEGGNTLELYEMSQLFKDMGIDSDLYDPREMHFSQEGLPVLAGRSVRHAYLKFSIQEFCRLRSQLEVFVAAVRDQLLFVQNGQRGRWIGDSKLCLALLSDPTFQDIFDAEDYAIIKGHIPWSRNIALCSTSLIQAIQENPTRYVLKRPFDTRGQGVVIGQELDGNTHWQQAVQRAVHEDWLVQEYCRTTEIDVDIATGATQRHDLALGAINGKITAALARSSNELRVNMALSGRLHPIFIER